MSNDILNLRRFGRYLGSDLRACAAKSGLTFCVAAASPVILYFFFGIFHLLFTNSWGSVPVALRLFVFFVVLLVLCVAIPVSCYGKITDKRAGSQFLMLPVSSFEKTASMIIISGIIAPAAFVLCYGALDALICLIDSGCGTGILSLSYLQQLKDTLLSDGTIPTGYAGSFAAVVSPLLYIDDIIGWVLVFLLGALWFKRGKVSKTILCLIALGTVSSIVLIPIMLGAGKFVIELNESFAQYGLIEWVFDHVALADTINDTVVNLVLATLIFLRVKTVKH